MGEKVTSVKEEMKEKFKSLQEELAASRLKIEGLSGKFDKDDDGKVTLAEAKQTVAENPSLWFNMEFWIALIGAIFGVNAVPKVLKSKLVTGRSADVNKNSGGTS